MEVVPVVEDVEEPVLQGELARVLRAGRHVRVDRRRLPLGNPALPVAVVAAGLERVAGEVEVVAEQPRAEILRLGRDLHDVAAPGAGQSNGRLAGARSRRSVGTASS